MTEDQYNRLLARITRLENQANDLAVAVSKFITLTQVNQVSTVLQASIDDLAEQVDALEARVTSIEEEPST